LDRKAFNLIIRPVFATGIVDERVSI